MAPGRWREGYVARRDDGHFEITAVGDRDSTLHLITAYVTDSDGLTKEVPVNITART